MENKPDKSVNDFNTEKNMSSVNNTNDEVSQLSSEQFSAIQCSSKDNITVNANKTGAPVNAQAKTPAPSTNAAAKQTAKKQKIIFIFTAIVALIVIIYLLSNASMCSTSTSLQGISVVEEELVTDLNYAVIGESLYPILLVKVKNTSSTTKKVSFEANFYADGELLGDDQASFVVLAPGDEAILKAQSNRGYKFWTQHEYSYKITKWWIFNQ